MNVSQTNYRIGSLGFANRTLNEKWVVCEWTIVRNTPRGGYDDETVHIIPHNTWVEPKSRGTTAL